MAASARDALSRSAMLLRDTVPPPRRTGGCTRHRALRLRRGMPMTTLMRVAAVGTGAARPAAASGLLIVVRSRRE
jgi:hypothetical protein